MDKLMISFKVERIHHSRPVQRSCSVHAMFMHSSSERLGASVPPALRRNGETSGHAGRASREGGDPPAFIGLEHNRRVGLFGE